MFKRASRLVAITAIVLSGTATVAGIASAVPGPGTFTRITTPGHDITYKWRPLPVVDHLTVSGQASLDVTTVDIDCIFMSPTGPSVTALATGVTVTGGSFSVSATIPNVVGQCRLRAIPAGVDPAADYVGSFSGPILYEYAFIPVLDGSKTVGFQAINEFGTGIGAISDASQCAILLIATLTVPQLELLGPGSPQCAFALPAQNITNTGTSTAPAIRVDGKNAYLPGSVADYLRDPGELALTLTQPSLTTTFSRNSTSGEMKVTETARLKRCNGNNTYPPTAVSCASLLDTGVSFKRVLDFIRGAHQVLIHDSYIANDGHAHTVTAQYQCQASTQSTGAPGYIYPHHITAFRRASLDQIVTGFGAGPATVLVRSDIYATSADNATDTQAMTWSRPPSKIQFSHTDTSRFAMPYAFSVPAGGAARVAFAESEAPLTADAKKLAAKAEAAL